MPTNPGLRNVLRIAAVSLLLGSMGRVLGQASSSTGAKTAVPVGVTADATVKLAQNQPMLVNWPVFFGPEFPKPDFMNGALVAAAAGPYTLQVRYFNATYEEVTVPGKPGRYGALIEAHFANGAVTHHRITLFHTVRYIPAEDPFHVEVTMPATLGLPADMLQREHWNVSEFPGRTLDQTYNPNRNPAVWIAALGDLAANPSLHGLHYRTIDNDWWLGLAEKLGTLEDYQRYVATPEGYDQNPGKQWPLIIYLHGSGLASQGFEATKTQGPLAYAKAGHLPFIICVPLSPEDRLWQPRLLARMLDELELHYRIDRKRVYVTGCSLGGYGTFDFAAEYPDRIAAIAPIAGGANADVAERLRHMPTWIFHGAKDSAVPAFYSVDIAAAMQRLGAPVKLSLFPDKGHGGWPGSRWGKVPFEEPDLYAWFLQQSLP